MNVAILGGGPAGLYLALLLKNAGLADDVRVVERNAPDATFGWGVVFSEETLGALRDADPETHLAITDTFARWDRLDIHYRGRLLSSRGHSFSAIARTRLLAILQERCRSLGVRLEFGRELADPALLAEEADLVVAADGANSASRHSREQAFGTSVEPEGCKYVWFGTDLVFDAFTFIFRETEHGFFQVHAYPFDEHASTFIVECPEPVWRRAGLDRLGEEESLAFCETLFAAELDGHRLLSNRSLWLDFPKVQNRVWHDGRLVLVGDAAHTAHFSIGSGTKLAMEDSIALANALLRRRGNLDAALVDYELERQPVVERFQQAASESAAYFGRVASYRHLEPIQFAFNLLTRSGRITHASLTVRDPGFTRVLDAWFAEEQRPRVAPPPMFAPLRLAGRTFPNRVVVADEGAGGGAGLVLSEVVAVSAEGRTTPECRVLEDDSLAEEVAAAHEAGALFGLQLGHAGRRGATQPRSRGVDVPLFDGWPLVSASPVPYGPFSAVPAELDEDGMVAVRADFAAASGRAAAMGVDVLELDFAHGYLLASFLSPLSNRRDDAYGGTLARRLRFPLSVLDAVRDVWPEDAVLAVRLSVTDWARGGLDVDDGIAVAQAMREHGCDLVHTVAGQTVAGDRPEYRRGFLTGLSDRVRAEARVPTLVGGYLTTPDEVNTIVASGRADLCILDLPPSPLERELGAPREGSDGLLLVESGG
ncbi:MAG TPA: FAD-dependent monooxygenase [Gaiellaceae bacterium]|nr:FAD-dependent monooxygenase [Gaiellaceae bacterium]